MPVDVVLGLQWGDEGKGKLVDILAEERDVVGRCAGGNNAGHTVEAEGYKYDFHLLPSGIIRKDCLNVIGNGVVINLRDMFNEIEHNIAIGPHLDGWESRLKISDRAHIVFDFHQTVDGMKELERGNDKIGTTKKGIGPTYSSKATRNGLRVCDLVGNRESFTKKFNALVAATQRAYPALKVDVDQQLAATFELAERLKPLVCDTVSLVHQHIKLDSRMLVEGANATMLDLDFGTYPYVTSSSASVGGVMTGLGCPPQAIKEVHGVVKAYTTRVGDGEFPTELTNATGDHLQTKGKEFGVTTGRARRCGWLDLVVVNYAIRLNGVTDICLTKLDILDELDEIKVCVGYNLDGKTIDTVPASQEELKTVEPIYITLPGWKTDITAMTSYEQLPTNAQAYIAKIEELTGVPVRWVGVGPARTSIISH
eukprot:m.358766 g.358766  ORF g.358766 m.358766 type:complete len:425 (-) comp18276_c0_seq1:429-1703(-)